MTILEAERVAALFGLTVRAQPLGSQQDSNFLLADGGRVLGVLKIANPAFSAAEIEAQDAAAAHIAGACEDLRVATVTHGPRIVPVDGGAALARVLRYLPGGTLAGAGRYLSPRVVAGLGTVAGRVSLALSSFEHPGLDRVLQWDLRHALRVVDALA
ncbi:MAG TPA: phosphotransferase, partial [Streptosporangiaceae bacterium]